MTLYIDADIAHELVAALDDVLFTMAEGDYVRPSQRQRLENATRIYEEHVEERIREAS